MNESRLPDFLDYMRQAATDARSFIVKPTPFRNPALQGCRQFFTTVGTVRTALPKLLEQLPHLRLNRKIPDLMRAGRNQKLATK
jgi:hypothetical protein